MKIIINNDNNDNKSRTESKTVLSIILLWMFVLVVCLPVFMSHGLEKVIIIKGVEILIIHCNNLGGEQYR